MTERDPIERDAEALFEAARREAPDPRVRTRAKQLTQTALRGIQSASARETAHQERPRYLPLFGAALVIAAAVLALLTLKRAPERELPVTEVTQEVIAPERAPRAYEAPAAREAERTAPARVLSVEDKPAPKAQLASKREPKPAPTLAEEIALLDEARAALTAHQSARVLALVERYEREIGGTRLRAEASLLRIEAVAQSGRIGDARKLAERFIADNPGNPLTDRARALSKTDGTPKEQ